MKKLIIFIAVIFIVSFASAETITLTSGKVIEGEIVERTDEFIKVDAGVGVNITVYLDEIKNSEENTAVQEEQIKSNEVSTQSLETDNALYKQAKQLLKENFFDKYSKHNGLIDDIIKGKAPFDDTAIQILTENASTLETFKKATQQAHYNEILHKERTDFSLEAPLPRYFSYLDLMRLLALQAKYHDHIKEFG